MSEFSHYDSYKKTNIPWIDEVPVHWVVEKGKRFHKNIKQINNKNICENILSLTLRGVVNNNRDNPEGLVPNDYKTYQIFDKDDLVFKLIYLENVKTSRVGLVHERGIMSSAYIRIKPNKNGCPKYYYYYYFSLYIQEVYNKIGDGVRATLTSTDLLEIPIINPLFDEQERIVAFLDQKTAEINEATAKKQRLIELLKEQKAILVNQAVTKGLNPNVPMRDSGVEWIGEIPAHWQVKKLRFLGKTQNGISAGAEYFGSGYPFVNYSDVYNNLELPRVVKGLAQSSEQDRKQYSIQEGDVLFTRTSETVTEIAYSSVCTETINDSTFSGFLIRFRPQKNILNPLYSKYFFSARIHRNYFVKEMNLVIRASLSQDLLKNLPVLLPPPNEQKQIALYCSDISKAIEQIINNERLAIEKLNEFKQTLIAHAVTGKIKV